MFRQKFHYRYHNSMEITENLKQDTRSKTRCRAHSSPTPPRHHGRTVPLQNTFPKRAAPPHQPTCQPRHLTRQLSLVNYIPPTPFGTPHRSLSFAFLLPQIYYIDGLAKGFDTTRALAGWLLPPSPLPIPNIVKEVLTAKPLHPTNNTSLIAITLPTYPSH